MDLAIEYDLPDQAGRLEIFVIGQRAETQPPSVRVAHVRYLSSLRPRSAPLRRPPLKDEAACHFHLVVGIRNPVPGT
jgi:hypothetical protein